MKIVNIPSGTKRISVADVFRLMLDQAKGGRIRIVIDREGKAISNTKGGLVNIRELQKHFLAFCHLKNVIPIFPDAPWTFDYEPTQEKNYRYQISVEEFQMFAGAYGIEVSSESTVSSVDLEPKNTIEPDESDDPDDWGGDDAPSSAAIDKIKPPESVQGPNHADSKMPGKLPRVAIGKLAIKAAWQIEIEIRRAASRDEVMARLQEWADSGTEPAVLRKSDKPKRGVQWVTYGGILKTYDLDACEKAIIAWRKSRR